MADYVPNLCNVRGEIIRLPVRKRPDEINTERFGRVAARAMAHRVPYFAVRRDGSWQIWPVSGPGPILDRLTKNAAEMWLMHRGR